MKKANKKNIQPRSRDFQNMEMALKDEADTTKEMLGKGKKFF